MQRLLRWPNIRWSLLCLALFTIIFLELIYDSSGVSISSVSGNVSSKLKIEFDSSAFHPPSQDLITTITARPLFSRSRRPYVSPLGDETPEIDIKLLCVLSVESRRTALVRLEADEKLIRVHERDFVSDWQVDGISTDHLYLRRDGHVRIVSLWDVSPGSTPEETNE